MNDLCASSSLSFVSSNWCSLERWQIQRELLRTSECRFFKQLILHCSFLNRLKSIWKKISPNAGNRSYPADKDVICLGYVRNRVLTPWFRHQMEVSEEKWQPVNFWAIHSWLSYISHTSHDIAYFSVGCGRFPAHTPHITLLQILLDHMLKIFYLFI